MRDKNDAQINLVLRAYREECGDIGCDNIDDAIFRFYSSADNMRTIAELEIALDIDVKDCILFLLSEGVGLYRNQVVEY